MDTQVAVIGIFSGTEETRAESTGSNRSKPSPQHVWDYPFARQPGFDETGGIIRPKKKKKFIRGPDSAGLPPNATKPPRAGDENYYFEPLQEQN